MKLNVDAKNDGLDMKSMYEIEDRVYFWHPFHVYAFIVDSVYGIDVRQGESEGALFYNSLQRSGLARFSNKEDVSACEEAGDHAMKDESPRVAKEEGE